MERETGQEKAPAANRGDGGFFQEAAHTQATGADRLGHERPVPSLAPSPQDLTGVLCSGRDGGERTASHRGEAPAASHSDGVAERGVGLKTPGSLRGG